MASAVIIHILHKADYTFYLTIEYNGRSLTLLLTGRNLYIRGWRGGQHGSFQIRKEICVLTC